MSSRWSYQKADIFDGIMTNSTGVCGGVGDRAPAPLRRYSPRRPPQSAASSCTRPMRRGTRSGVDRARPERRLTVTDGEENGLVMPTSTPASSRLHLVGQSPRRLGHRVQERPPFGGASAGEPEAAPEAGKRPVEHATLHELQRTPGASSAAVGPGRDHQLRYHWRIRYQYLEAYLQV